MFVSLRNRRKRSRSRASADVGDGERQRVGLGAAGERHALLDELVDLDHLPLPNLITTNIS